MSEELEEMILFEVRQFRKERRYKEALDKLVSFHEDLIKDGPSESRGCGYFVLQNWIDLSSEYPPALDELKKIRLTKTNFILSGGCDVSVFSDLEIINEALDDVQATIDLFQKIENSSPEFAARSFRIVVNSLIDSEHYSWARKYMSSPELEYDRLKRNFKELNLYLEEEESLSHPPQDSIASAKRVYKEIFAEGVLRLIAVLKHTNDFDAAVEIEKDAILTVGREVFNKVSFGEKPSENSYGDSP